MFQRTTFSIFLISVVSICLFSAMALGQTSIGYTNPDDISNLLEYRLPDWSYRIWDANFSLDGSGMEARSEGIHRTSNRINTTLGSSFHQTWESEQRLLKLGLLLNGGYSKYHSGNDVREFKNRSLNADYILSASVEHYLGDTPFHGSVGGYTKRDYDENSTEDRIDDVWSDDSRIWRSSRHYFFAGIGFGHLRNVVPLLRAQRLSERLVTMGRPALSGEQIQNIAHVLATEYGYRYVFDRYDRHFWGDIISPLLEEDNPLTPFEIFYLTDIMNEEVGNRHQGFKISAGFSYYETTEEDFRISSASIKRSPTINMLWYHNLSLKSQIYFTGEFRYEKISYHDSDNREYGILRLRTGYYWNLADRYSLDTTLSYYKRSNIEPEQRLSDIDLGTNLRVYLEDKISLNTGISLSYDHTREEDQNSFSWRWVYTVGLMYHLDRALF